MITSEDIERAIRKRGLTTFVIDMKTIPGKFCIRAHAKDGKWSRPELAHPSLEGAFATFFGDIGTALPTADLEDLLG